LVTFLAQARRARLGTESVVLLLELSDEHETYLYKSLPARSWRPRTDGSQVRRDLVGHRGHSDDLQTTCKTQRHPRKV
jgi:hypothetical protein